MVGNANTPYVLQGGGGGGFSSNTVVPTVPKQRKCEGGHNLGMQRLNCSRFISPSLSSRMHMLCATIIAVLLRNREVRTTIVGALCAEKSEGLSGASRTGINKRGVHRCNSCNSLFERAALLKYITDFEGILM
eukprot:RCo051337